MRAYGWHVLLTPRVYTLQHEYGSSSIASHCWLIARGSHPIMALAKKGDATVAVHPYSAELVKEVQSIIDHPPSVGIETAWQQFVAVSEREHIHHPVENASPALFLVHHKNRGGLGLNPHNCQRNVRNIRRVGANLRKLDTAWCFELQAKGARRERDLECNRKIVRRAQGILAPITGAERYVTVGCGHTAAGCKAALAGCKASEPEIADESGFISLPKLQKDKGLATMLVGWDWNVIPDNALDAWPSLADFAQRAQNASNSVPTQSTELEVGSTMAEFQEQQREDGGVVNVTLSIEAAVAGNPPCRHYAEDVAKLVELVGGGSSAPQIKRLDSFAKLFGTNVAMGSVFTKAIVNAIFYNKIRKHVYVRLALVAALLTGKKVEDGIAKLLTKTDIQRLCSKSLADDVDDADQMLETMHDIISGLVAVKKLTADDELQVLGRSEVRAGLFLTDKQKASQEERLPFKDMVQIRKAFLDDVKALVGEVPTHPWGADICKCETPAFLKKEKDGGGSEPSSHDAQPRTVADLTAPTSIAREKGFNVNDYVVEKRVTGNLRSIFQITSIGDIVALKQHVLGTATPVTVQYALATFLAGWSKFGGDVSVQLPLDWASTHSVMNSVSAMADTVKVKCFNALMEFHTEKGAICNSLMFQRKPDAVFTTKQVATGRLIIAPAALLNLITTRSSAVAASLGTFEIADDKAIEIFINPPAKPHEKTSEWKDDLVISPYHWVSAVDAEADANMRPAVWRSGAFGVTVPTLVNTKLLQANTKLTVFKAKQDIVPLASAISVTKAAKARPATKASPAKRQRTDADQCENVD